jgi:hypothetical protein
LPETGPPPPAHPVSPHDQPVAPRHRREALLSGPVFTVVAAIVIVLSLAIVGIIAGQALSR